jgi:mRNA interferase MazF
VCSIGENVGYENDGKGRGFQRPVLIVSGINRYTCVVVPLSTTDKRTPYHYGFDGGTGKPSVALIRQVRVIDTSRLLRRIGKAQEPDLKAVKERLRRVLGI